MSKAKKKVCQYATELLKFDFKPAVYDERMYPSAHYANKL